MDIQLITQELLDAGTRRAGGHAINIGLIRSRVGHCQMLGLSLAQVAGSLEERC